MKDRLEEVSMLVSQSDIDDYAFLTDDFNPLHVDPEFAANTPMGNTIAHGTLSVNLIWQSLARSFNPDTVAQLDLDIRFLKPLFAGETITASGQRNPSHASRYEVWVKDSNGTSLIAGHVDLPLLSDEATPA